MDSRLRGNDRVELATACGLAQGVGGGLAMMSNYGGDEQQENSDDGGGEGDSGPFRVSRVVRMLVFKLVVVVIQV